MEAFQSILLGIHIICAVFIVVLVLLQPSTGDGSLVSTNMGVGGVARGRSVTSFLQKFTLFVAIIFMANVLFLGVIGHTKNDKGSKLEQALGKIIDENNLDVPKGE